MVVICEHVGTFTGAAICSSISQRRSPSLATLYDGGCEPYALERRYLERCLVRGCSGVPFVSTAPIGLAVGCLIVAIGLDGMPVSSPRRVPGVFLTVLPTSSLNSVRTASSSGVAIGPDMVLFPWLVRIRHPNHADGWGHVFLTSRLCCWQNVQGIVHLQTFMDRLPPLASV